MMNIWEMDTMIKEETQHPILDKGFIQVIDYMGGDDAIVQAARVSYGVGTKTVNEDRGLIRYLMRHRHTTPFEMCTLKILVRVPMDCWRQWIRHRTASVNELSTRYSEAIDAKQQTMAGQWRMQSSANKQGSAEFLNAETCEYLCEEEIMFHQQAERVYKDRLAAGVAREQARKDLPLSTYTEAYWKIDLHNLFHFLSLRMDAHAQHEIRQYADFIGHEIVAKWCPLAWEAFVDYRLNALYLTSTDKAAIRHYLNHASVKWNRNDVVRGEMLGTWPEGKRELKELLDKMELLGMLEMVEVHDED